MYRVFLVILLCLTCATSLAVGADLPSWVGGKTPVHFKRQKQVKQKQVTVAKPKKIGINLLPIDAIPEKPEVVVKNSPLAVPSTSSANLSWVLDPLVANADGGKNEGSASVTGNIIVDTPGTSCDPEMIVDLEGHIVKTVKSTARLDINVGKIHRSVVWNSDDVKSGTFNITLKEKVEACVLGDYIPVSALAFVTKEGEGYTVMVSLEKITVRHAVSDIVGSQ
jgi:hypothetical protein